MTTKASLYSFRHDHKDGSRNLLLIGNPSYPGDQISEKFTSSISQILAMHKEYERIGFFQKGDTAVIVETSFTIITSDVDVTIFPTKSNKVFLYHY